MRNPLRGRFVRLCFRVLVGMAALIVMFSSCSSSEPRITYYYMGVVNYAASPRPAPRLTFFVLPEDDDGIADIDEIKLYHDTEGLCWSLRQDSWVTVTDNNKQWIGAFDIAMPGDARLPSGLWRAVIIDKGGGQSEKSFGFDYDVTRHAFPKFSIDLAKKTYVIDTTYPQLHLLCYDQQGNNIVTVNVEQKRGAITDLRLNTNVRSVALWAEDAEYHCSALTEIKPVR